MKNEKYIAFTRLVYPCIEKGFNHNPTWGGWERKYDLITKMAVQTLFREERVLDTHMKSRS